MAQQILHLQAPAKINLHLRITGRRPDGYHLLDSRMQKLEFCDELAFERLDRGIELVCADRAVPVGPENLVWRAAALFFAETRADFGVRITLRKHIPVAAGLGGGSSDAAATFRALLRLSGLRMPRAQQLALALRLGADVPFFMQDAPAALARGVGEMLQPVAPLVGPAVLLVHPGVSVSTKWVYQSLDLTSQTLDDSFQRSAGGGQSCPFVNDLEPVTVSRYPVVGELKAEMAGLGAEPALMSGSGATVFGLFADREQAKRAFLHFQGIYAHTYLTRPLSG